MKLFGRKRHRARQNVEQRIMLQRKCGIAFGRQMFNWRCDYPHFEKPTDCAVEAAFRQGCQAGWISEAFLFEDECLESSVETGLTQIARFLEGSA